MTSNTISLSERLEIVEVAHATAVASFADDVSAGLRATAKRLSSKYFYDDLGSALFEAITLLPEYYLTRAETEILTEWGWQMSRSLDGRVEFFDLGSGSSTKTRLLIEEALRAQGTLRYSPVDISTAPLKQSATSLADAHPNLSIRAYAGDYYDVLSSPDLTFEPGSHALFMFMGANIGNYAPADAHALLAMIARKLRRGDGLLLGVDLRKDARELELAYDDPTGVTSAFNKNLLGRINRELGATFDLDDFEHVVKYDEPRGCVDSFLRARRPHAVRIAALELDVAFEEGESIHTESSYKYNEFGVARLAEACGLHLKQSWRDKKRRFSVNLLLKGA